MSCRDSQSLAWAALSDKALPGKAVLLRPEPSLRRTHTRPRAPPFAAPPGPPLHCCGPGEHSQPAMEEAFNGAGDSKAPKRALRKRASSGHRIKPGWSLRSHQRTPLASRTGTWPGALFKLFLKQQTRGRLEGVRRIWVQSQNPLRIPFN